MLKFVTMKLPPHNDKIYFYVGKDLYYTIHEMLKKEWEKHKITKYGEKRENGTNRKIKDAGDIR